MSQGSASPQAQPPSQDEAVLGEVLLQQRSRRQAAPFAEPEDPDLALAKLLQAQEQVWMAMAGAGSGVLENVPPAGAAGSPGASGQPDSGREGTGVAEQEEEQLTDEEMARRLQEEEEREFQQRMLALAGMAAPPAGGARGDADSADAGAGRGADYFTDDEVDPDDMTYEELTALGEAVGTVSKGLTQAQFEALPQQHFFEVASAAAGTEEEQCPVCRVEYGPEDCVKVLPRCKHYGHPDCLAEWLKRNKVCCICNTEVIEDVNQARAGGADGADAGTIGGVLGERRQQ